SLAMYKDLLTTSAKMRRLTTLKTRNQSMTAPASSAITGIATENTKTYNFTDVLTVERNTMIKLLEELQKVVAVTAPDHNMGRLARALYEHFEAAHKAMCSPSVMGEDRPYGVPPEETKVDIRDLRLAAQ